MHVMEEDDVEQPMLRHSRWSRRLAWGCVAALALGVAVLALALLPMGRWIVALLRWLRWVDALGAWAAPTYGAVYVALTNAYAPGWVFQVGAGFLFGLPLGLGTMVTAISASALLCLLLVRVACGACVRRRVETSRWGRKLPVLEDALVRHEWKVTFLLRLSPAAPFTLTNQLLALTRVRAVVYGVATLLGTLPNAVLYVSMGAAARSLGTALSSRCSLLEVMSFRCGSPAQDAAVLVGMLATLCLVLVVGAMARRALRNEVERVPEYDPDAAERERALRLQALRQVVLEWS